MRLEPVLLYRPRDSQPVPQLMHGQREAQVIELRPSEPPLGYGSRWLRLLALRVVELGVLASINSEAARKAPNMDE